MDMYQKRKIRAEKKNNDSQKSFPSVGINWYPGHMAKTKRNITDIISMVDIVIEVIDARIPFSSRIPDLAKTTRNKQNIMKYIILLESQAKILKRLKNIIILYFGHLI